MDKGNKLDFCEFSTKESLKKQLDHDETILYSDSVVKYNYRNKAQRRFVLVTNKGIYNAAKGMSFISDSYVVKRRIDIGVLCGVTVSKHSAEYVIHCANEYDYRMRGDHTKELIPLLKDLYQKEQKRELCVFEYDKSSLIEVCTTKVDAKRKVSKLPDQIRRDAGLAPLEKQGNGSPTSSTSTSASSSTNEKKPEEKKTAEPVKTDEKKTTEPVKEEKTEGKTEKSDSKEADDSKKEEKAGGVIGMAAGLATKIQNKANGGDDKKTEEKKEEEELPRHDEGPGDEGPVNEMSTAEKIFGHIVNDVIYSRPGDQVTLDAFELKKVIGRGSFGKVMLVIKKDNQQPFALKSLRKDVMLESDQIEHTRIEKEIMQSVSHEFLMGMEYCFQTPDKIYFVTKYMSGGDMFTHLKNAFKFKEQLVRFYVAQIALGLDYLHHMDIIYRDMKPENVLVGADGYLKLTDFGMAKKVHRSENIKSFYGTPEYIAPEALKDHRFEKASDWWSLGVLMFEMLVGAAPFYNQSTEKMYELIKNADLRFPLKQEISPQAKDLLSKMLTKDPAVRLGADNGVEELKSHAFFKGFDWDKMQAKEMEAPWKPTVDGELDTSNFDSVFTNENPINSVVPDSKLIEVNKRQGDFMGI